MKTYERKAVIVMLAGLAAGLAFLPAPALAAQETGPAALADYACDKSRTGRPLDLSGARVTFEDEFLRPSITPPEGKGPWYAPMHGGFGGAKFLRPDEPFSPFFYSGGYLKIRMSKRNGRWYSGLMQSVNAKGQGFTQSYGYFEMRALFPKGQSNWPAFWLKTVNQYTAPSETRVEIDVIEAYGGNDLHGYHGAVHLWPAAEKHRKPDALQKHWSEGCYRRIPGGLFDGQFHTYGAEITPELVIMYFDRKEVFRFRTLPEFKKPVFMLVDLAYSKAETRTSDAPSDMLVDYVRVWQRPEWKAAAGKE